MSVREAMGWQVVSPNWPLRAQVFRTRDEAIRYEAWNLRMVRARYTRSLEPWMHVPGPEVSKAWRRLKRQRGMRAVRVLIQVHPKYAEDPGGGS